MSELSAKEKKAANGKKYRENNKEKIAARAKLYYKDNKEKAAARAKLYYESNKEKAAIRGKKYHKDNKEKIAARKKQYHFDNKERLNSVSKKYRGNNKEKSSIRDKKYREDNKENTSIRGKKYRENNPLQRFFRGTLRRIEKAAGKDRINKAENQLAYTQKQFIAHTESLWLDGMSWDNRSEWHIDHIKPISLFIKEGITDAKIINALSNLQPLWAYDNLSKGAKYEATSKDSCQ